MDLKDKEIEWIDTLVYKFGRCKASRKADFMETLHTGRISEV